MSREPREWIRAERKDAQGDEQLSYGSDGIVLHRTRTPGASWSAWHVYGQFAIWRPINEARRALEKRGWSMLDPAELGMGEVKSNG